MHIMRHSLGSVAILSSLWLLTACGKTESLPNTSIAAALQNTPSLEQRASAAGSQFQDALPKILLGIEEIRQELHALRFTPVRGGAAPGPVVAPGATPAGATTAPRAPRPSSDTATPSAPSSTAPAASQPAAPQQPSGQAELAKILQTISSASFVQANVEKTEKNRTTGKAGVVKINMFTKKPNVVKLEVVESSSGAAGAKVLYNSNEGNKAKVRPGGAMSFITTELPKTDDRLASGNGYTFDDIDLFSVHRRLSQGYEAELVGKTQVAGKSINILKVTTSAAHSMGDFVDYEYFGYEPDTYKIKLWEIYEKGSQQPFYRMVLTSLEFPANLPDSIFKL